MPFSVFRQTSLILLVFSVLTASLPAVERQPVPDAAALEEANALVKEVFGEQVVKARRPADQRILAKKLLENSADPANAPATSYVLLQEAKKLALEVADVSTLFAVLDRLEGQSQVSLTEERLTATESLARTMRGASERKKLVQLLTPVVQGEFSADRMQTAFKASELAAASAKLCGDANLREATLTRHELVEKVFADWPAYQVASTTLKTSPQDKAAQTIVGTYLCLQKGNWIQGLPHLVAGNDEALKKLAQMDLAAPKTAEAQAAVGDAWWDASLKETGTRQAALQLRAIWWYLEAIEQLEGLNKSRIEKRVAETNRTAITSLLSGSIPLEPLLSDAILVLPFNQAPKRSSGKTILTEMSKSNFPIEVIGGATWVANGRAGGAMKFDGGDQKAPENKQQRLVLGNQYPGFPLSEFTISVWLLPENNEGALIGSGQRELWPREWHLAPKRFAWRWVNGKSSGAKGEERAVIDFAAPGSGWRHLVITRKPDAMTVYVNGQQQAQSKSYDSQTPLPIYGNGLMIGNQRGNSGRYEAWSPYVGLLDEMAIWPRPLSAADVQLLYQAGRARQPLSEEGLNPK